MQELILQDKTFNLTFSLDDIEFAEERLGCSIFDLHTIGIKGVRICLFAAARGQNGVERYEDIAPLVTLENYRQVDDAVGGALLPALQAMTGSAEVLAETDVGES